MADKINTHPDISTGLVGRADELTPGKAQASLLTLAEMAADERGLVHGGFIFGLADYAAMLAVNDPNVVLGAAQSKFLAPVTVGDVAVATAVVVADNGRKRQVECHVKVGEKTVFQGEFTCFVLDKHVLDA